MTGWVIVAVIGIGCVAVWLLIRQFGKYNPLASFARTLKGSGNEIAMRGARTHE